MDYTALPIISKMEIIETLKNITKELDNNNMTEQRKRYLEGYMVELKIYLNNHLTAVDTPSPLELYCDLNPQAPECLKYDV